MSRKPNILVIMSDQHHAGVMGCAGDQIIQTPNLDRLATQGVRFSNAYCSFPLCGPSRMSFMTGRDPHKIDQWDNNCELRSDIPTFADAFSSSGYDTILSGRMHFVGSDQRHGFQERIISDVSPTAFITAGWRLEEVVGDLHDTCGMGVNGIIKSGPGRTGYQEYDETVTKTTLEWLENREGNETPFLLTVGYVTPHCPFVAPPEDFDFYRDRISKDDFPSLDDEMNPRNALIRKRFGTDPIPPIDAQWRTRVAYYGLTAFLDRQVGAVISALEKSGLSENTIIVYCSDHGEMLGEHGMWWKTTFYDGACRVPLIITWPGNSRNGEVRTENVSLMDIAPTLTDLAGVDSIPGADGRSLSCLLNGEDQNNNDPVFAEDTVGAIGRMVRKGPWKYNYYHEMGTELYNLEVDADESINLIGKPEYSDIEKELHHLVLQDWNPEEIEKRVGNWQNKRKEIRDWIIENNPPEPDPVWFKKTPENWVDNSILP